MKSRHKRHAFYWPSIEHESNIHKFRVDRNITVIALSEKVKVGVNVIIGLQNGTLSPTYLVGKRAGKLKPYIEKICETLGATPGDLFPRYICDINRKPKELLDSQIADITIGAFSRKKTKHYIEARLLNKFIKTRLNEKEQLVIIRRFKHEEPLEDVGKRLNMTRERVRQIEAKALRKLRQPSVIRNFDGGERWLKRYL